MSGSGKIKSLKQSFLFTRAYTKAKFYHSHSIVMYVLKNGDKTENRLGITVSKKRGNAVKRNRARRIIREAYRSNMNGIKKGFIIVVVAKQACVDSTSVIIGAELEGLLKKAALM